MKPCGLRSMHASCQYRGVHHRAGRRRSVIPRRRLPDRPGPPRSRRSRLPPDELRALRGGDRDLRPPLLDPGPAARRLRVLRRDGRPGELDGLRGDGRPGPLRPAAECALRALRAAPDDDGLLVGRRGDRAARALRPFARLADRAARDPGRRPGRAARLRDGLPGRGGAAQGAGGRDRTVRGGQQHRRHERPHPRRLGRPAVGLAGGARRDRAARRGLRGGLPLHDPQGPALQPRLARTRRPWRRPSPATSPTRCCAGCTRSAPCS